MKYGQALAFQRLVEILAKERLTIYIIAEHNELDTEKDIELSECAVRKYWFRGDWKTTSKNVGELIQIFLDCVDMAYDIV